MIKTITANLETLQQMIEALDTLRLRYTVKNMYLPISQVKEMFAEMNRQYDGATVGLNEALNNIFTGYVLSDSTVIPVWLVTLHR